MKIRQVVLHRLIMPLQMRFETSFGVQTSRDILLVEVEDAVGATGWGECVALTAPLYNEETTYTAEALLRREIIPRVLGWEFQHPAEFQARVGAIHRHFMAKSAVEGALWDLYAKRQGMSLAEALGGAKTKVPVGVSLGIQPIPALLEEIGRYVQSGYQRIKVKIKPGWDRDVLGAIRTQFPDVPLTVDANAAYGWADRAILESLDEFRLMMIEQPFAEDAWDLHAALQARLRTPICLDESIHTQVDVVRAIQTKACRIVNVKVGRIGGLTPSVEMSELAREHGVDLWCGGMLETGVGRAHNIAVATLPGFTMPGDTAASARYWDPDIIEPEVEVSDGFISVPDGPGMGYAIHWPHLRQYQVRQEHFRE